MSESRYNARSTLPETSVVDVIPGAQAIEHYTQVKTIHANLGRDAETGREHGGQTERERSVWIATNSSRLNAHFRERPAIVDVLPSIAAHMNLDIPADVRRQLDGQSFID